MREFTSRSRQIGIKGGGGPHRQSHSPRGPWISVNVERAVDAAPEALIRASYLGGRGASHGETLSTLAKEMLRGLHAEPGRYALGDDELARIDKPVLMIWGQAEDGVILSIAEARMKAALMPNARFEVLAGGHEPWLDDPNGRADLVSAFLRTGSAARTSRQFGT